MRSSARATRLPVPALRWALPVRYLISRVDRSCELDLDPALKAAN
jgi:hypothetical protein